MELCVRQELAAVRHHQIQRKRRWRRRVDGGTHHVLPDHVHSGIAEILILCAPPVVHVVAAEIGIIAAGLQARADRDGIVDAGVDSVVHAADVQRIADARIRVRVVNERTRRRAAEFHAAVERRVNRVVAVFIDRRLRLDQRRDVRAAFEAHIVQRREKIRRIRELLLAARERPVCVLKIDVDVQPVARNLRIAIRLRRSHHELRIPVAVTTLVIAERILRRH